MKAVIVSSWVLTMGALGFLGHVTSVPSWLVLTSCAIFPPLVMMRYWKQPAQTLSESIGDVLR